MSRSALVRSKDLTFPGYQIVGFETDIQPSGVSTLVNDVETVLHSIVLPANWLESAGDGILFAYHGNLVATAGATDLVTLTLGGVTIFTTDLFKATAGGRWTLTGHMAMGLDGGVYGYARFESADLSVSMSISSAPDLSIASTLALNGTGHTASDITRTFTSLDFRGQS